MIDLLVEIVKTLELPDVIFPIFSFNIGKYHLHTTRKAGADDNKTDE